MKVFGDKDKILIEAEKGEKLALLEMDGAIQVESVKTPKRKIGYIRVRPSAGFTKNLQNVN